MENIIKYLHDPRDHNLEAPGEIVPLLMQVFEPWSVVDYGCGIGNFLHVFKEMGVGDIQGYDAAWVPKEHLYIPANNFKEKDLEQALQPERRFDLVLCLEVAEHLNASSADILVNNLTALGDKIIFSAAVPNQGGQYHVNEQPVDYWIKKFKAKGFVFYDVFRDRFWDNPKVNWWYKQNMFLVMHEKLQAGDLPFPPINATIRQYIHPDLLAVHAENVRSLKQKLDNIQKGRLSLKYYLQLLKAKTGTMLTGYKNDSL